MKDLFDYCDFGDLKLNSRIVRTGLWESQREKSGNMTPDIYNWGSKSGCIQAI